MLREKSIIRLPKRLYILVFSCAEERWKYINFSNQDENTNEEIKIIPQDALDYIDRADIYFDKENYKAAIDDYNEAINWIPTAQLLI